MSDKHWESGITEPSGGRITKRERFLISLSISDKVFGTVEVEPNAVDLLDWPEEEGFSSTPDVEYDRCWEYSDELSSARLERAKIKFQ